MSEPFEKAYKVVADHLIRNLNGEKETSTTFDESVMEFCIKNFGNHTIKIDNMNLSFLDPVKISIYDEEARWGMLSLGEGRSNIIGSVFHVKPMLGKEISCGLLMDYSSIWLMYISILDKEIAFWRLPFSDNGYQEVMLNTIYKIPLWKKPLEKHGKIINGLVGIVHDTLIAKPTK